MKKKEHFILCILKLLNLSYENNETVRKGGNWKIIAGLE